MGFTPLDGLMMAARCGSLDPAVVLHVQLQHGPSAQEVEQALNHESGLLGVSGISGDMREVMAAARAGGEHARLAVDVYTHRVRHAVGALAATLGGVDALILTAGVARTRRRCARRAAPASSTSASSSTPANARCRPDADVAPRGSRAHSAGCCAGLTMLDEVLRVIAS